MSQLSLKTGLFCALAAVWFRNEASLAHVTTQSEVAVEEIKLPAVLLNVIPYGSPVGGTAAPTVLITTM